jgi:hypothetical protein
MFKEYRLEVAVVMALIATAMLHQGNPMWPIGFVAAGINYVCFKKGI